jgi:hypothetical protein
MVYYSLKRGLDMPVRYTGIRLLLVFVATNTVMILMLVTSMTSKNPWLAHVLPGQFYSGGNYSGYWVFFSLVLLVDAVTVLIAALMLMLPAMRDSDMADQRRFKRYLTPQFGLDKQVIANIEEGLGTEYNTASHQLFVGRSILLGGALFLVIAFAAMALSFARAMPENEMFARQCVAGEVVCQPGMHALAVKNDSVRAREIGLFTVEQISGAVLLDAPEVYGWHIGALVNNNKNALFSHFVFSFRTIFGLVMLLTLLSLRFPAGRKPDEPGAAEPASLLAPAPAAADQPK